VKIAKVFRTRDTTGWHKNRVEILGFIGSPHPSRRADKPSNSMQRQHEQKQFKNVVYKRLDREGAKRRIDQFRGSFQFPVSKPPQNVQNSTQDNRVPSSTTGRCSARIRSQGRQRTSRIHER
jgi:hypothetical protein